MVAGTNVYTVPCQPDIIFDGFGFMGFFVTKSTKKFPSRANLGKIGSQLWWWLCIRVGWCPWKDDDWCYSRRSRLKNNQRRDVQGFYRARTPIRLVHSKQSPAAESGAIVGSLGEIQITNVRNLPPPPSNTLVFVSGLFCRPSIIVFWLQLF